MRFRWRIDALNLVLFFDSEDRPRTGGEVSLDIWYSLSIYNEANWSIPENASSIL